MKNGWLALLLMFLALGQHALAQEVKKVEGCALIKQSCKLRLKQTGAVFEVGGVDFSAGPVQKVGQIKIGRELLQQMTPVAQILDQLQFSRCELLNRLTTCDALREKIIIVQAASEFQLFQLALIAQLYSAAPDKLTEEIAKWIVQSTDTIQKIYAKQFMAADAQTQEDLRRANEALRYAVGNLKVSPGTPEFQKIPTENRLTSLLNR